MFRPETHCNSPVAILIGMRFRLRTLLIVLALGPPVLAAMSGCRNGKVEQIQRGAENVDRHAKEIEKAAEGQPQ